MKQPHAIGFRGWEEDCVRIELPFDQKVHDSRPILPLQGVERRWIVIGAVAHRFSRVGQSTSVITAGMTPSRIRVLAMTFLIALSCDVDVLPSGSLAQPLGFVVGRGQHRAARGFVDDVGQMIPQVVLVARNMARGA